MSLRAIVSGMLAKPPVLRTSKAGKPYITATVRDGEAWVNVLIFNEEDIATLEAMSVGEPISVAGPLEASVRAGYVRARSAGGSRIPNQASLDQFLQARFAGNPCDPKIRRPSVSQAPRLDGGRAVERIGRSGPPTTRQQARRADAYSPLLREQPHSKHFFSSNLDFFP